MLNYCSLAFLHFRGFQEKTALWREGTEPTRGRNILNLIFSLNPESVNSIEVISGVSIRSRSCKLNKRSESDDIGHPVFLYDWVT